jgi:hypothetical protein
VTLKTLILPLLLLLQLFGIAVLVRLLSEHVAFFKRAKSVAAAAIASAKYQDFDGRSYATRCRYAVDGNDYVLTDSLMTSWRRHRRGQALTVYYAPHAPEKGRLRHPSYPVIYCVGIAVMGSICVLIVLLIAGVKFSP